MVPVSSALRRRGHLWFPHPIASPRGTPARALWPREVTVPPASARVMTAARSSPLPPPPRGPGRDGNCRQRDKDLGCLATPRAHRQHRPPTSHAAHARCVRLPASPPPPQSPLRAAARLLRVSFRAAEPGSGVSCACRAAGWLRLPERNAHVPLSTFCSREKMKPFCFSASQRHTHL